MLYTGDFVLRYYVGFSQIRSQIKKFKKEVGIDYIRMYIKSKETSQTTYVAINELTRVINKFIPTFGKLMDVY